MPIPEQLICTVDYAPYVTDWRQRMASVTVDGVALGESGDVPSSYRLPPGFNLGIWDFANGDRLHVTAITAERRIELSVNYDYPTAQ